MEPFNRSVKRPPEGKQGKGGGYIIIALYGGYIII